MHIEKNEFIPAGLPLLADYSLMKTVVEYRHVLSVLRGSISPSADLIRTKVQQALQLIEGELLARGLKNEGSSFSQPNTNGYAGHVSGPFAAKT